MKTNGQSVPPELAAIYAQLVATNATAPGGVLLCDNKKRCGSSRGPAESTDS
jgi:hypothetical protein